MIAVWEILKRVLGWIPWQFWAALALAAACWWGYHAIEEKGFDRGTAAANASWQKQWAARDAADAKAVLDRDKAAAPVIAQEGLDYVKATSHPVTDAPRIELCKPAGQGRPGGLQSAAATGSADSAKAADREADPGQSSVWDSTPTVTAGRDADVIVDKLWDYIDNVCRKNAK